MNVAKPAAPAVVASSNRYAPVMTGMIRYGFFNKDILTQTRFFGKISLFGLNFDFWQKFALVLW